MQQKQGLESDAMLLESALEELVDIRHHSTVLLVVGTPLAKQHIFHFAPILSTPSFPR